MATRAEVAPTAARRPRPARLATANRYSVRERVLFVVALVTFAVATFYASLGLLTRAYPALFPGENAPLSSVLDRLGPVSVKQPDETSVFNKRQNVLILGLDKRPDEPFEGEYRTDTIMVATIDPITKRASALGFPRDLYIEHNTGDGRTWQGRINESYEIGYEEGGSIEAGAEQAKRDLMHNFGIEITHWVVMDFTGVETLIDALGGITIDVPPELAVYDWRYSDEGGRPIQWLTFPPGEQHLNGYEAVAFGRNRNPDDTYRVRRQQLVMQAATQKAFSLNLLDDPRGLYEAYKDVFRHDISLGEAPGLANLLRGSGGEIETYSLGDPVNGVDTVYNFTTNSGAAVLGYHEDNVRYWLNLAFPKTAYSASNVEIQNGYGVDGRQHAEALGRYLRFAKGLPTVYVGPPQEVQPHTTIHVYDETRAELANDIAGWMGVPPERITWDDHEDPNLPDVVVIIGEDFILPGG